MLSILSLNLRNSKAEDGVNRWQLRKNDACAFLAAQQPDLIGLQEATGESLCDLTDQLGENYICVGMGRVLGPDFALNGSANMLKKMLKKIEHTNPTDEFTPIFFRQSVFDFLSGETFWLSPTPHIVASRFPGQCELPRICTKVKLRHQKSGLIIVFYNTHFDHLSSGIRDLEAAMLVKRLSQENDQAELTLLGGDFNFEPHENAYAILTNEIGKFQDLTEEVPPTFHAFEPEAKAAKIDYIFSVDRLSGYRALSFRRGENGALLSDHDAVRVEVPLGKKA